MRDTSEEMEAKMCELMMQKTPADRLRMGCSMYETSRYLMIQGIRHRNPTITRSQLMKKLFLAYYNDDFDEETKETILKKIEIFHKD